MRYSSNSKAIQFFFVLLFQASLVTFSEAAGRVPPERGDGQKPLIADALVFGDSVSEKTHALKGSGQVRSEKLRTEMGGIKGQYAVRTVQGSGSRVSFSLTKPAQASALILEVQEIHDRRSKAFGYMVNVNGCDVYFRTYEEIGAGPNHYFVSIPAEAARSDEPLTVTITSAGAPAFSLGQVWLYEDFFGTVEPQEQVFRPLPILSMSATSAEAGNPGVSFAPFGDFIQPNYANKPYAAVRQDIHYSLTKSGETGRPLQILINGPTWGGAFSGPDGLGGYFNDVRYSMLAYDKTRDLYSPSFPNMWSSSFFATFRDPHMNAIMKRRFMESLGDLSTFVDFLKARGKEPQAVYARELGPPMGEVTAATIAAAAKEGVVLNPRDGLDETERLWLYRDSVRLWQEYAAWHAEVFPRESVVVDRGTVRLPKEQAVDNQYAHTIFKADGPMKDRRWFGGQAGMVDGFWSSGEVFWDAFSKYDYLKANGRLAFVNLTVTILKNDCTPLRNLYDSGFQFVTFYQDTKEFTPFIHSADRCEAEPAIAPVHHEPTVLEALYNLQQTLGAEALVASSENVKIHTQNRDNADMSGCKRLAVADCSRPGQVTYHLDNGGEPFTSGLTLHLDGQISLGSGNRIEVLAGETLESLRLVAVLTDAQLPCPDYWTLYMTSKTSVDLGKELIGRKSGFLRLVLHAEKAPDATFLMDCRVTTQWPHSTGHLAGNPFTMQQQRTLQLWIQDRAVARRLLEHYGSLAGDEDVARQGRELFDQGRYCSVQRLINGEISQVLPARYAVRGHGKLGRYPVQVRLPEDDQVLVVTLHSCSGKSYEFSVNCDVDKQPFEISLDSSSSSAKWSLNRVSENRYRLEVGTGEKDSEQITVKDGRVTMEGIAVRVARSVPALPGSFIARYLNGSKASIQVDTQNLKWMNYENSIQLKVAKDVQVVRSAERLARSGEEGNWPKRFDRVELTLNAKGEVSGIRSSYGHDSGRIKSVIAPSLLKDFTNGGIVLENGNSYEFHYDTQLDTVAMHDRYCSYETQLISQGLKPGQEVSLDYSPYAEMGASRRLIKVTQPYRVLLAQDFTKGDTQDWKANAISVQGLAVKPHKPEPNFLHDLVVPLLRPEKPFEPGSVIYRVRSDRPLKATVVEFTARAFEDSSAVEFSVSTDGIQWISCGLFDNSWQNSYAQSAQGKPWSNPWKFMDLTQEVQGHTEFLLKATLRVHSADERFCVGQIRVVTEETAP